MAMHSSDQDKAQKVVMEGKLQLKAGFVMFGSRWRACTGSVTPTNFELRRWSKGKTQLQSIAIESISEIHTLPSPSASKPSTEFEVGTKYKTLKLRASSAEQLNAWIAALREAQKLRTAVERHRSIAHNEVLKFDPDPDSNVFHRVHGGFTKLGPIHGGFVRLPPKRGKRPTVSVKKIQVVATLGPSSWTDDMLTAMIGDGVNIFRLNFSHRQPGMMEDLVPRIRAASRKSGLPVKILADLQGPKFRINDLANGKSITLKNGEEIEFALATSVTDLCTEKRLTMKHTKEQERLISSLEVGSKILIQDGKRSLEVTKVESKQLVRAKVIVGGSLKGRQGVNVPNVTVQLDGMTEKDIEDANFILDIVPPVDYIAISFVQDARDLKRIRSLAETKQISCPLLIPKIETRTALLNLDEILDVSDGLMVARGDLGMETGLGAVPRIQKELVKKCNARNMFCIVATQMLESMIKRPIPTRAEISDVTNAVLDGADALMLSAESAIGVDPLNAVTVLRSVAAASSRAIAGLDEYHGLSLPTTSTPQGMPSVVVTLGPSSFSSEVISRIVNDGRPSDRVTFRISLTHFSVKKAKELIRTIRTIKLKPGNMKPKVMISLAGPVYQLEEFEYESLDFAPIHYMPIAKDELIKFSLGSFQDIGDSKAPRAQPGVLRLRNTEANSTLLRQLQNGTEIWLESGTVKFIVTKAINSDGDVTCRVVAGSRVKGGSFVDVKNQASSLPAFTAKDRRDVFELLHTDIPKNQLPDIFAVPSVESADDVVAARVSIAKAIMGRDSDNKEVVKVCANLERKRALDPGTLESILDAADMVLIARGSLAMQVDSAELALVTKSLVHKANESHVPVVVGTQMLESMLKNAVPTRAEVSDIYNAVLDGANGLLLNAETAVGAYPVLCVEVLRSVAYQAVAEAARSSMTILPS